MQLNKKLATVPFNPKHSSYVHTYNKPTNNLNVKDDHMSSEQWTCLYLEELYDLFVVQHIIQLMRELHQKTCEANFTLISCRWIETNYINPIHASNLFMNCVWDRQEKQATAQQ